MSLVYGSVCSGIEAASVAWHPLGWRAAFLSEIDAAPRAILRHHYPSVPLHGDFTTIRKGDYADIDVLVGGPPCQDFSVAGRRGGLDGERGGLTLAYADLAYELGPSWMVWENVPGVFSNNEGRDFGAVIACFAGHPAGSIFEPPRGGWRSAGVVPPAGPDCYGLAWRVLDAQYVRIHGHGRAVPQRRRRVILVGYLGDWRRAAAVLLERSGLSGDSAPRRGSGEALAESAAYGIDRDCLDRTGEGAGGTAAERSGLGIGAGFAQTLKAKGPGAVAFGGNDTRGPIEVSTALNAHGGPGGRMDFESETFIAQTLLSGGHSSNPLDGTRVVALEIAATLTRGAESSGKGGYAGRRQEDDVNLIAFDTTQITSGAVRSRPGPGDPCHPLAAGAHPPAIAFNSRQDPDVTWDRAGALGSSSPQAEAVAVEAHQGWAVRRLTPLECERLQGFPDGWTAIPYRNGIMADGPRYKALGNSMAVNVMRWVGWRIAAVEEIARTSSPPAHGGGVP